MSNKTKRKIEAMAKEFVGTEAAYEGADQRIWECGSTRGATPWAEWCERFEKELVKISAIKESQLTGRQTRGVEISEEYRQWLEDENG